MQIHILTGDALQTQFLAAGIDGEMIVCRECLVVGEVAGKNLQDLWNIRADYIHKMYFENKASYLKRVAAEFEKIGKIENDEVNVWFEFDLFCQVNMWFVISLLKEAGISKVFKVNPLLGSGDDRWNGFSLLDSAALKDCYNARVKFNSADIALGCSLWNTYRTGDLVALEKLSKTVSPVFPYLEEVCKAEIERKKENRPKQTLSKIIAGGTTDFYDIFSLFWKEEAIYGFGDAQVKILLDEIEAEKK